MSDKIETQRTSKTDGRCSFYLTLNERSSADSLSGKGVNYRKILYIPRTRIHEGQDTYLWRRDEKCQEDMRTWGHEEHGRTLSKSYIWPVPLPDNESLQSNYDTWNYFQKSVLLKGQMTPFFSNISSWCLSKVFLSKQFIFRPLPTWRYNKPNTFWRWFISLRYSNPG